MRVTEIGRSESNDALVSLPRHVLWLLVDYADYGADEKERWVDDGNADDPSAERIEIEAARGAVRTALAALNE